MYIEELIGPDTVNTVPPATLEAFQIMAARASLTEDVDGTLTRWRMLAGTGISMKDVTDKFLAQGVQLFADAFDKLLSAVGEQGKDRVRQDQSPDVQVADSLAAGLKVS